VKGELGGQFAGAGAERFLQAIADREVDLALTARRQPGVENLLVEGMDEPIA
jgi:hypothetical protein